MSKYLKYHLNFIDSFSFFPSNDAQHLIFGDYAEMFLRSYLINFFKFIDEQCNKTYKLKKFPYSKYIKYQNKLLFVGVDLFAEIDSNKTIKKQLKSYTIIPIEAIDGIKNLYRKHIIREVVLKENIGYLILINNDIVRFSKMNCFKLYID